jgi:hypothetical protein
MFTQHAEDEPTLRRQLTAINCGFEKVEHLAPSIGYLKFNLFAVSSSLRALAASARASARPTSGKLPSAIQRSMPPNR